jgi:hypothetical protein
MCVYVCVCVCVRARVRAGGDVYDHRGTRRAEPDQGRDLKEEGGFYKTFMYRIITILLYFSFTYRNHLTFFRQSGKEQIPVPRSLHEVTAVATSLVSGFYVGWKVRSLLRFA